MADKRAKQKGRKGTGGGYLALPHIVMNNTDFRNLNGSETKTLLMLGAQYKGNNNGDLQATHGLAKQWGIGSQQTLCNALQGLISKNLIIRTREGVFLNPGRKCALYGLTWLPIDPCSGKLDIAPTQSAPRAFSIKKTESPLQKLEPFDTETVAIG